MYWIEESHEKLYAWWKSDGGALGPQEKVNKATEAHKALGKARARQVRDQEEGAGSPDGTPSSSKRAKERRGWGGVMPTIHRVSTQSHAVQCVM